MIQAQAATVKPQAFVRHLGPVTCVVGIPNSNAVFTSAYDGAVGCFDIESGSVELLGYHDHLANRITVNAAGTIAASSSADYTIYLWDVKTRRRIRVLRGHSDDVEDFAFIDDHRGVSISQDARVIVWNLDTGAIERIMLGHEKCILSVEYHAARIFTSGDDRTLRVWDLKTGEMIRMWGPFEDEADSCAIDGIHGRAVLGCDDGKIRAFDLESGDAIAEFPAHLSGIKKVAVSPVNGDVLSAAYDQKIYIWDANGFEKKVALEHHPATWERSFNWSPDGQKVLAGTFDGTVIVWDAVTGKTLGEFGERGSGNVCFNDVSANKAGDVVTVSDDGLVRVGRLTPNEATWLTSVEPATGRMLANAVTMDERSGLVVTGTHNQKLHIFEKQGDRLVNEIEVAIDEGPINCVRVAHHAGHEGQIFVACYDGPVVRVDREGNILGKMRAHDGAVKALRLHPEKCIGVSCSSDGAVATWDFEENILDRFVGHTCIADDVDLDPTGTYITSVSRDFTMKVYRLQDGKLLHSLSIGRRSPKSVCFLDPDTVIVANYWGWLLRFDLKNEQSFKRQIAQNGISSVARSGDYLVAVSYDGVAYLVDPRDLSVVRTLRTMTQRPQEYAFHG